MNLYSQTPGERIKLSRQRLGLTQQELADQLNEHLEGEEIVERSLISRWEQDKNFPRNHRKTALEEVLNIDLGTPALRVLADRVLPVAVPVAVERILVGEHAIADAIGR